MDPQKKSKSSGTKKLTISLLTPIQYNGGVHLFITHVFFNQSTSSLRVRLVVFCESKYFQLQVNEREIRTKVVVNVPSTVSFNKLKENIMIEQVGSQHPIYNVFLNRACVEAEITASKAVTPPVIQIYDTLLYKNMKPYIAAFVKDRVELYTSYKYAKLPTDLWDVFPDFNSDGAREFIDACVSKFRHDGLDENERSYLFTAIEVLKKINAMEHLPEAQACPEFKAGISVIKQKLNLAHLNLDELHSLVDQFISNQIRLITSTPREERATHETSKPVLSSNASSFWQQHKKGIVGAAAAVIVAGVALASCV